MFARLTMAATYFILESPRSERLLAEAPDEQVEIEHCPNGHLKVYRRAGKLQLHVKHNQKDESIVWKYISGCAVHESIVTEFERHRLTGCGWKPATVRFEDGEVSDHYKELTVTGWAGMARPESGITASDRCGICHAARYTAPTDVSRLIDWSQWTGDDFFVVWPLPNLILITERAAELLLKLQAKSFALGGFEDIDPIILATDITPGRLSNYFPSDLVTKYGHPLGLE